VTFTTRFAPSPTGPLHLGHAYSALLAHDMALAEGGSFLLRIEDIDQSRSRQSWEQQIYDDLHWLGLAFTTAGVACAIGTGTWLPLATLPMIAASWLLMVWPPPARQLKRVGWTLVVATIATATIVAIVLST